MINIFLDDERVPNREPIYGGEWTIVRDILGLQALLIKVFTNKEKIQEVTFDWYLGVGIVDGYQCAEEMVKFGKAFPECIAEDIIVDGHSSNWEMRVKIARKLQELQD